jgi:membrane-associated protein
MSVDEFLGLVGHYRGWIYGLLFAYALGKTGPLPMIAGYVSASGALSASLVGAVVLAGTLLGSNIRYGIGRWGAPWLFETFPRAAPWLALGAAAVGRFRAALLPLYRFSKGTYTLVGVGAGIALPAWWRFVLLDALGALLWTAAVVGIGLGIGLAGARIEPQWAAYVGLTLLALGIVGSALFGSSLKRVLLPHAEEALLRAQRRRSAVSADRVEA